MKRFLLICLLFPLVTLAQSYPSEYFRNPLGIPILLAGNFGECRSGHFHSGLDIKTNGKENLPVYAAADGYVSRIKMDKGGFGHALYITHPNGYTTLYAHLNKFSSKIQRYLRSQQYSSEKWDIDLQLKPEQFPVSRGEQIAYSGNTGSSTAPHLHFEIRDTKTEYPLNPQLFGLKVTDTRPPIPIEIALYDLNKSIYEQTPVLFALQKKGDSYVPSSGNNVTGMSNRVGIGIHVNDYMNGSENTLNFYNAKLYANEQLVTEITLDDIGYDVTRYLHAYADYKTKEQKNKWIQCLFRLSGNKLGHIYKHSISERGEVTLPQQGETAILIELTDNSGNTSIIEFTIRPGKMSDYDASDCNRMFKPNQVNTLEDLNVSFALPETALYDDICFRFSHSNDSKAYSPAYQLHYPYVPVHNFFDLNIKPDKTVPFDLRDKIAMVYSDGKDENGRAASYTDKGWYQAAVRNFGIYKLIADTNSPVIAPLAKAGSNLSKAARVSFTIKDAITSIKKYRAEINGKWILLEQHGNTFFYEFDEHCPKGKVMMSVTAADENDNTSKLNYVFIR